MSRLFFPPKVRFSQLRQIFPLLAIFTFPVIAAETLIFSTPPIETVLRVERMNGQLTQEIETALNQDVGFRTRKTLEEFVAAFNNGDFDIAILHPYYYIDSVQQENFEPILRKQNPLSPIFVTIEPEIENLQQLRGKNIAIGSRTLGFAETGIKRLTEVGLMPGDYHYFTRANHGDCLRSLINKIASACLTLINAVKTFEEQYPLAYRVIDKTDAMPTVIMVVRKSLGDGAQQLRQHLLELDAQDAGKEILERAIFHDIEAVTAKDYEAMENPFRRIPLNGLPDALND